MSALLQGHGETASMSWSQEKARVESTCYVLATPTVCSKHGVNRVVLKEAGLSFSEDLMALLISLEPGISTRSDHLCF